MRSLVPAMRGALGAAALALPLLASGCNTYILWQDARSSNREWLEKDPLPTYAWFGADGVPKGLVLEPSASARERSHRLLPSSRAKRWLLIEGAECPETIAALALQIHDDHATLTWVEHMDGSPGRVELVRRARGGFYSPSIPHLAWRTRRYPGLYGPTITIRLTCHARWIEEPPKEALQDSKLQLALVQEQVQDDDLGPVTKLALTPLTLAADLPFLPLQLIAFENWFP